jgi:hypothetical protein
VGSPLLVRLLHLYPRGGSGRQPLDVDPRCDLWFNVSFSLLVVVMIIGGLRLARRYAPFLLRPEELPAPEPEEQLRWDWI